MDPPPLPSHTLTAATTQLSHPDSTNSSPCSRPADTLVESLPLVPGAKLRLMCSYGGHIIPRPHDKSLCYVGGDTRMVVVDRHSSLSDFSSCLSRILLSGRQFKLKYQLPNEDLDSLISIATDEDLENLVEEYDRISSTLSSKYSRLRLFLFPAKPATSASMGSLLDDAKSETWFVDALNGAGLLPRGLSDSAAIDCLLELDHGAGPVVHNESCIDLEAENEFMGPEKLVKIPQDMHQISPDSQLVETNSSFGSNSSSPSMSNLPPIKVRVKDGQMVGLDEHLSHLTIARKQDDGVVVLDAPPSLPTVIVAATTVSGGGISSAAAAAVSDDERSDHGAPTGFRKPPLPLQPVQRRPVDGYNLSSPDSKLSGGLNLPSPDSVASDSSVASATSLSKHIAYQEPAPAIPIDPKGNNIPDPNTQIQMQQLQHSSAYMLLPPQNQHHQQHQQFVQPSNQNYIHHHPATAQAPLSSYYQMYAPPPQQQQLHPNHQIDPQYPMYLYPINQTQVTQSYNLPTQSNIADATVVASTRPPPLAAPPATPPPAQVQFQQQYMGVSQVQHHPSQITMAANYGYEYSHPTHDQVYYAQYQAAAPMVPQHQNMTQASAVLLSQASDNTSQQIRTSPPL